MYRINDLKMCVIFLSQNEANETYRTSSKYGSSSAREIDECPWCLATTEEDTL